MKYRDLFRKIHDYPKPGIIFEDVTTYWKNPEAFTYSLEEMKNYFANRNITKVVGLEARGFVIAAPLAYMLGAGFVPVRKPDKLPAETIAQSYELEYDANTIEIHKDAITPQDNVLLCDDILATGGTLQAAEKLVLELGGHIEGIALLSELVFLKGREKLSTNDIFCLYQVQE